ncbi:4733_t:CDS:2, partial [Dentiscutata erythropus]
MSDEHSRPFKNVIDKHLGSSAVEQYWISAKKQHKCLVDSNVTTEHNISSNQLTSEFQEIEANVQKTKYCNDGYTSPSPLNVIPGGYSLINNPFIEDIEEDKDNLVVDDI